MHVRLCSRAAEAPTRPAGKRRRALALLATLGLAASFAPSGSALAETSKSQNGFAGETPSAWAYCERAAIAIEATHKLPRALLVSVAMAESGRYDAASGKARPWPWTINAEGRSHYFASKREAVAATRRLLKGGMRSIDVGCMQVNLRYHPEAFADLNEAFDPIANATYAAGFLKRLHGRTASWPKAIAQYHSESPARNKPYFARVIRIWTNERDRVAALTRLFKEEAAEVAKSLRGTTASMPTSVVMIEVAAPTNVDRPAPMVLGSAQTQDVREGAVATVGLRLSIAEDESEGTLPATDRPAPRVIDTPTILADASSNRL